VAVWQEQFLLLHSNRSQPGEQLAGGFRFGLFREGVAMAVELAPAGWAGG